MTSLNLSYYLIQSRFFKIRPTILTDNEIKTIAPLNQLKWREWLMENHSIEKSVWLIYFKKRSKKPFLIWSEAVEQALCFGWIDSLAKPLDNERYMQFFTRRKPGSVWSKINKEKIQKLIDNGQIHQAGFDVIRLAKQNGSWTILDEVEALIVPGDLQKELIKKPNAKSYFDKLSRSDQKNLLQWLVLAKKAGTRLRRINEIVEFTNQNLKPKILQQGKKTGIG